MSETPRDEGIPDRYDLPEKALGGADAVPDTNYLPPEDEGPEQRKGRGPVGAAVSSGNGAVWGIIAFLIVAAVLVFVLGLLGIGQ
ncbi:MAG: hypothetical protein ACJ8AD_13885 [Gemmatimonadaceae bacterium]